MRQESGQIIIEPNDCIQVVKGEHIATLGIVLDVKGAQLLCWGRSPAGPGTASYTFNVDSNLCMYIGKGRIKPTPRGAQVKTLDQATAAQATRMPQEPPQPRTPVRTRPAPQTPPAPMPPSQSRADSIRERLTSGSDQSKPGFGGVDSDMMDLRPKPTKGDDISPDLLKPAVFSGPNSREMHGLPQEPTQQPQQQDQNEQLKPKRVNPFRKKAKKAKKVSSGRKIRRGKGQGQQGRSSLGLPVEGQDNSLPPWAAQASGQGQAADNSLRQQSGSPAVGGTESQGSEQNSGD